MITRKLLPIALTAAIGFTLSAPALARNAVDSFGSPVYVGAADLPIAFDLIEAGGGAGSFSVVRAWETMIGPGAVQDDLTELARGYGQPDADQFVRIFNFAIADAWTHFGADDVNVPGQTGSTGPSLAVAMVRAGTAPDGAFWTGYMLGHILTPRVYRQVTADIDARYGSDADARFHRMSNQFFNAVAQQVDATTLGAAPNG
jgi:hypothetical protein